MSKKPNLSELADDLNAAFLKLQQALQKRFVAVSGFVLIEEIDGSEAFGNFGLGKVNNVWCLYWELLDDGGDPIRKEPVINASMAVRMACGRCAEHLIEELKREQARREEAMPHVTSHIAAVADALEAKLFDPEEDEPEEDPGKDYS